MKVQLIILLKNSHLDRHPSNPLSDYVSHINYTMSDHHVRWSSFNGEHQYVDHIYYMIHARPFGLRVPRPYLYMLGSSSLTRVFRMCKPILHSLYVNVELITPDHHVVSRHDEL